EEELDEQIFTYSEIKTESEESFEEEKYKIAEKLKKEEIMK
ncbi:22203_t:CDS:1, partial [Gigaspora rosea]